MKKPGKTDAKRATQVLPDPKVHPEAGLYVSSDHPSRTRLLLAGLECFAELGYHGTTTRDITRMAGVSAGGLYTHFESKQQILQVISRTTHKAMLKRMTADGALAADAPHRLKIIVHNHAAFHARYSTSARVANYELHSLDHSVLGEMQKLRRKMEGIVADILDDGRNESEFHIDDVGLFSKFILSSGIDVSRWYRHGGQLTPEELGIHYSLIVLTAAQGKPALTGVDSMRTTAGLLEQRRSRTATRVSETKKKGASS